MNKIYFLVDTKAKNVEFPRLDANKESAMRYMLSSVKSVIREKNIGLYLFYRDCNLYEYDYETGILTKVEEFNKLFTEDNDISKVAGDK